MSSSLLIHQHIPAVRNCKLLPRFPVSQEPTTASVVRTCPHLLHGHSLHLQPSNMERTLRILHMGEAGSVVPSATRKQFQLQYPGKPSSE
ncbi:hypothetical protein NQZ68_027350 [Dissostichus eleginoides]|nr:hypothetical protein NQZ68_027350 [Dissostichus eleginoides]